MAEFYPSSKRKAGEGHITILGSSYDSIGQGTWLFVVNPDAFMNGYTTNEPPADGDNLSYKVYLDVGTYTLMFYSGLWDSGAIVDIDIDGVEVASFDLYAAEGSANVRLLQTGIPITTAGLKTLKLRGDGCNPESGGPYICFYYIALWRTA